MTDLLERSGTIPTNEQQALVARFLAYEAKILDERRFDEWLELLDDEVLYEVPLRLARLRLEDETAAGGHRMFDNKARLSMRVDRLNCGECWSETPPSRTLRLVGSVLVSKTDTPDVFEVDSALLLYRQRGEEAAGDVIPVRRTDLLRITADGLKLLKRRAMITDTVLRTPNLGVFL